MTQSFSDYDVEAVERQRRYIADLPEADLVDRAARAAYSAATAFNCALCRELGDNAPTDIAWLLGEVERKDGLLQSCWEILGPMLDTRLNPCGVVCDCILHDLERELGIDADGVALNPAGGSG